MADWRKLALQALVADGKIDNTEVKLLKKELWADGRIDKHEVAFLIELRNTAQKKNKGRVNPTFEKLFFKAMEEKVLDNGIISAGEARWLREMLFADNKIDANEKKFLRKLKRSARKTAPEFEALYAKCMKKR